MSLTNTIEQFKDEFYQSTKKNMIFKKAKKQDSAKFICEKFDINQLLANTILQIPNTNKIYINYPLLKSFAYDENYNCILEFIIKTINQCIQNKGDYEFHMNIKSFTVSAIERYKPLMLKYCQLLGNDTTFSERMTKMYIYHIPVVFDMIKKIAKPCINPLVNAKINIVPNDESDKKLDELLGNNK
jgi:hypothetical protein